MSQLFMIVQIFVTQRQPIYPLRQHLFDSMLNPGYIPTIDETFCKTRQQLQPSIGFSQQQTTRIGSLQPSIEPGHDLL